VFGAGAKADAGVAPKAIAAAKASAPAYGGSWQPPAQTGVLPFSNRKAWPCLERVGQAPLKENTAMLTWALIFLVVALVAGVLGFTTIAGASIALAKILFMIFLVLFVVSLVMHLIRGRTVV